MDETKPPTLSSSDSACTQEDYVRDPKDCSIFYYYRHVRNKYLEEFSGVDTKVKIKCGGHVAQIYGTRQAIFKAFMAYCQKCINVTNK